HRAACRRFVEDGDTLLVVGTSPEICDAFAEITDGPPLTAAEADVAGYAMLTEIDFEHPLFAALSDARFSDFTQIHFWRHRAVEAVPQPGTNVLARFDDGGAALIEAAVGRGRALLLTAGWQPRDSQLALSSKFVPLMNGLLDLRQGAAGEPARYTVGDAVPLLIAEPLEEPPTIHRPDDAEIQLASGRAFTGTVVPGVYAVSRPMRPLQESRFAVNVSPEESRTAPLPPEELEALGLPVTQQSPRVASRGPERQLRSRELEDRQKLWRWLVVAALVVILIETLLAGRWAKTAQ
ncbi:MAG: hypothetical protein ACREIV_09665, partial [Planctomycetaceae bacterium]